MKCKNGSYSYDLVVVATGCRIAPEEVDGMMDDWGRREGVAIIPGLPMFVHQGLAQFERWTGHRFPLAQAIALLEETLAARSKP